MRKIPVHLSCALTALTLTALLPAPARALDLAFPAPVAGVESEAEPLAGLDVPTGPFADGRLPVRRVEGALDRRAWQLDAPRLSLTELASPLRDQLLVQGYTLLLDCETRACGGFDFRFAISVMAEPGMHVDLGDFRFISAERGEEALTLLISRSPGFGFVQLTRVAPEPLPEAVVPDASARPAPDPGSEPEPAPGTVAKPAVAPLAPVVPTAALPPGDVGVALEARGAVVLEDLAFASGSAALEDGEYGSLTALAGWLAADPGRNLVLVGHTDSSGGLEANIALSKRRAEAVRQALIVLPGVAAGQVAAEGVGPLAPRATNLTEEGRYRNRRVEAVMTSTQ